MSNLLFIWELGGGSGHYARACPVLVELARAGHFVQFVGRRPPAEALALFPYLPTPTIPSLASTVRVQTTFADVLWNNGLGDDAIAAELMHHWTRMYRELQPDLVICDHSPLALLVARFLEIPAVVMGTGFCCPPLESPFPNFRDASPVCDAAREREQFMLDRILRLLRMVADSCELIGTTLASVLFGASTRYLCTYRELDHYPTRGTTESYWGTWQLPSGRGPLPVWPSAEARYRAFAYVKPHPHVFELLCVLSSHDISLLVYSPGLDPGVKERLSLQGRIRFLDEPANMVDVVEASDFLVLNAGHGSTATALLSGTPILQMPLNMEQVITARNTVRIGAGAGVDAARPLTFNQTVGTFLARLDEHRAQANFFAEHQPTCEENYAEIARQVGALL